MIDNLRVFIDTAPFIYFFEANEGFSEIARDMFFDFINNDVDMITSYISEVEMKVLPKRNKQTRKIINMDNFIDEFSIVKMNLYKKIYDIALEIRANYPYIKLIDAFQLAIAIDADCDYFITNDKELKKYKDINVVMIDEYKSIFKK